MPCDAGERKYCGGSWKGITNHLDYIQGMGFDAVWISPVSANFEGNSSQGEAFHGCVRRSSLFNVSVHIRGLRYWTKDFDTLNPHFGTTDDLHALSDALHKRGMYLMFDVVVNHMAAPDPKANFTNFSPPFSDASSFHKRCFVVESADPRNQTTVEQCWLGDAKLPLPDLNTENPTVVNKLLDWVHKLVQDYGVDGLRIDTVKHIRKDFWPEFSKAAGVFTLGEVFINDTEYASQYTRG